jgi:hypothetical protein
MIGAVIESQPSGRVPAILFLLIGIAFVFLSFVAGTPHAGIFAILPFCMAVAARQSGEPRVRFTVTEEGLDFEEPGIGLVRYSELCGLTAPSARKRGEFFPMQIYFPEGAVRITASIAASSSVLHEFLYDRLSPLPPVELEEIPSALRTFVSDQIARFGTEKVKVYPARTSLPLTSHRPHIAYSWGLTIASGIWLVAGVVLEAIKPDSGGPWIGFGILFLFVGFLFALIYSRAGNRGRPSNWRESCLVVSPGGIALVQGRLRGKMRWDELRAVEFPAKHRLALTSSGSARSGIGLLVEGAYLIVGDYYVRPLSMIFASLRSYWGGQAGN